MCEREKVGSGTSIIGWAEGGKDNVIYYQIFTIFQPKACCPCGIPLFHIYLQIWSSMCFDWGCL